MKKPRKENERSPFITERIAVQISAIRPPINPEMDCPLRTEDTNLTANSRLFSFLG